ncbi:MAG TPA: non-homologous end-joining DNA ligase [Candidatus Acidoferrales bacterium]
MPDTIPFRVQPMLASLAREPFARKGWVFEEKYDGYRLVAYKEGKQVQLYTRNAIERSARYPHIAEAIRALPAKTLVLDGEAVVFDRARVSKFQLLQRGAGDSVFVAFDVLFLNGKDLRREPLSARRAVLEKVLGSAVKKKGVLRLSQRLAVDGVQAYKIAAQKGLEGMIAKDLSSKYTESRSNQWLKVKVHQEDEFVIGGFTKPEGSRSYFGSLLLGAYKSGKLYYTGKVGTGFDEDLLASLHRKMQPLVKPKSSFIDLPREKNVSFLEPKLVAQVSYSEITEDGRVRQAVFVGLRDDKSASEVRLPGNYKLTDSKA